MPLVAPTNTATRREGSEDAIRAFEAWTAEWETMFWRKSCSPVSQNLVDCSKIAVFGSKGPQDWF